MTEAVTPTFPGAPEIARIVLRARGGDPDAFAEIHAAFARSVHGILLARLPPADADDAVQETFLLAWRRLETLREPERVGPWLHAIARNVAIDRQRARARRGTEEPLYEEAARSEDRESDDELRGRVLAHLQSLPEAYRETLALRLIEGLTGPEIAEATGMTAGSVRVNLHRGMEMLRDLLRKEGWA
jgi:RNA polymerase sigma-70 factor (ECF subfamily)